MFGSMLILLATIGQPGASAPPRQWIRVTDPRTGQLTLISGWYDSQGMAQFNPVEYPWLKPAPTTPPVSPSEAYPTGGVVIEKMPSISAGAEWRGGNVPDTVGVNGDEEKPPDAYITVIGDEPKRSVVRQNWERSQEFRDLKARYGDRLAVHYYSPKNPMVAKVGLPDGGQPDVILQDAKGGEVGRWHDDPGAAVVAVEARRLLDPNYRPGGKIIHQFEGWAVSGAAVLIGLGVGVVVGALIVVAGWMRRSR